MKKLIGKWVVLITAIAMIFSIAAIAGCTGDSASTNNGYTVKVVGLDDLPYTTALVQACEVEDNGSLSTCYNGKATNSEGVVFLEIGKDITNAKANHMEIHLLNLPPYLTYTAPRMHKGEEVTIKLRENVKEAESGTGEGSYTTDALNNTRLSFDPYIVGEGAYRLKFTSAEQNIYFAFQADEEALYKVYSVGTIDAAIKQIYGTVDTGYFPGGEEDGNDNVSATDKNFSYEFEVSPSLIEQNDGVCYFEVSLKNSSDVNKDAIICFEYVDEWVEEKKPETVDVLPKQQPLPVFPQQKGEFVDAGLFGDFVYEMGADGFYHVGDENGPILCASLGQDTELNERHTGNGNAPRTYDIGFTLQYREKGQSFTVSDGKTYSKNYYPLIEAYTKASSSDGRYGVTEELKEFLDAYINEMGGTKLWVEKELWYPLPEGEEWLWACGYYEIFGTEENPYLFDFGDNEITVPEGESVWYNLGARMPANYLLTSDSTNISVKWYKLGSESDVYTATSDENGFSLTIEATESQLYYLELSTKDGAAATFTLNVEIPAEEGSDAKPIVIEALGTFNATTRQDGVSAAPMYYTYTITDDATLYFSVGANTTLTVSWVEDGDIPMVKSVNELSGGLKLPVGVKLKIEVVTVDGTVGPIQFTISNTAS